MDAFSEILRGIVLKGALYFNAEFSAPWGFRTPATEELAQLLTPGAPHLMIYHFLVEGSGVVRIGVRISNNFTCLHVGYIIYWLGHGVAQNLKGPSI